MAAGDLDLLADRILSFARTAIIEDGFVIPVGACVDHRGEVVPLKRIQEHEGNEDAAALVEEILRAFRTLVQSNNARSVAWCADMRVVPPGTTAKTDAIVVFFESDDGSASVLVSPYRDAPGPTTVFATPYSQPRQPAIFASR